MDEAVDQQRHDESKGSEEHPRLGGKFLMSSYSEQSGRRFWVESERGSSHSSSLGSQDDVWKAETVSDRGYQLQRSYHEQSGRGFGVE
eukprot:4969650-Karenia_brevis.AAC.1